mmetsp:Transcript_26532/g.32105  ORF Transcript_26532/g.32105 Transcript_26532/m.32105 type:complete len:561 (+) Transcript_26532:71-1753(+)
MAPTKAARGYDNHHYNHSPQNAVPVQSHRRNSSSSCSIFDPMLLTSCKKAHSGPIWCMEFSSDGKFLATGGQDKQILVWEIIGKNVKSECILDNDDSSGSEGGSVATTGDEGRSSSLGCDIQLLSASPVLIFDDHDADIIDISWSRTNFLLSASLDKTARLYHPSKPHCLQIFRHSDMVTSVHFHPNNDDYLVTGGFDRKVRIWSIKTGEVKDWTQVPDIVSVMRFTPRGDFVVCGLIHGQVIFLSAEGLRYYTQMACKNRRVSHKDGKKVTGLEFMSGTGDDDDHVYESDTDVESVKSRSTTRSSYSRSSADANKPHVVKRDGGRKTRKGWFNWSFGAEDDAEGNDSSYTESDLESISDSDVSSSLAPSRVSSRQRSRGNHDRDVLHPEKMLVTTNDSRLRLYGLNDYCMVRKFKGLDNSSMQISAHFSESGKYIICGSEDGNVYIWDTHSKGRSISIQMGGLKYDKNNICVWFQAAEDMDDEPGIVTNAIFAPLCATVEALHSHDITRNHVFEQLNHDMSSVIIVTGDYNGNIKVFVQKLCLDKIAHKPHFSGLTHSF